MTSTSASCGSSIAEFEHNLDRVVDLIKYRNRALNSDSNVADSSQTKERSTDHDHRRVIPTRAALDSAILSLQDLQLPEHGLGTSAAIKFVMDEVNPGLLHGQAGERYYGFVTGGVTASSQLVDMLVSSCEWRQSLPAQWGGLGHKAGNKEQERLMKILCGWTYYAAVDENVQVTLPDVTVSTAVESRALDLVLDLLRIDRTTFQGRTATTGATASNVLGLACGRDAILSSTPHLKQGYSVAEDGFPPHVRGPAFRPSATLADSTSPSTEQLHAPIQIITVRSHGSIAKAAALTGIGRANIIELPRRTHPDDDDDPFGMRFDLVSLKEKLAHARGIGQGIIVVANVGEVNTGAITPDIPAISQLCRQNNAWLHIDGAFGGFAALLPQHRSVSQDMSLADSLTLDAHKWLNVPYDCAMFYCRRAEDLQRSMGPSPKTGLPPYLRPLPIQSDPSLTPDDEVLRARSWHSSIPSPLNVGIENSRRFRALPLFASLLELGHNGYEKIIRGNCEFAQAVAKWMLDANGGQRYYELLNHTPSGPNVIPLNVVLFRGRPNSKFPPQSTPALLSKINQTSKIYLTATGWSGLPAVRLAVSNHRTSLEHGTSWNETIAALEHVMS